MKLNMKQTRNLVALFWRFQGRLPAGTTNDTFDGVTMGSLQLDNPPVPGDPDYEHTKYAVLLTQDFNKLGIAVPGILEVIKADAETMKGLWDHCYRKQRPMAEEEW